MYFFSKLIFLLVAAKPEANQVIFRVIGDIESQNDRCFDAPIKNIYLYYFCVNILLQRPSLLRVAFFEKYKISSY
jgi:hypothetical protein